MFASAKPLANLN